MKRIILAALAVLGLSAGQAFAACAGVNVLAGGCSQAESAAVNETVSTGTQAVLGFNASTANNTVGIQQTSVSAATPVAQAAQTTTVGSNTSSSAGIALGGAIGAQGAAGVSAAAGNAVGVGGFGINVFALPTP